MRKQALQAKQLQASALVDVGLKLAQAREQREFSVEEMAAKTHIPARLLSAIEAGDMGHLPEPVYIQSFIRQYANAIGLNGVQLASEFPVEPVVKAPKKPWLQKSGFQLRPVHLYAVYMVMILGAVQGLSVVLAKSANQTPVIPNGVPNSATATNPVAGPNPQQQNKPQQNKMPPSIQNVIVGNANTTNQAVRVDLTSTEESWVSVIVDGKQDYEGTLKPGEKRQMSAKQRVTVTAGNAGAVIATYNGGEAKPLGNPGDVQEVSFPPEPKDLADMKNSTKVASTDE
jgi:cytoskeletal protein RodZ